MEERKGNRVASCSSGVPAFPQGIQDVAYPLERMPTPHHQTKVSVAKAESGGPGSRGLR